MPQERNVTVPIWWVREWKEFDIAYNHIYSHQDISDVCKHASLVNTLSEGYYKYEYIYPRVVVALNEAGYNSTWVCIDCILEALDRDGK